MPILTVCVPLRLKGGLQEAKIRAKAKTVEGLQINIDAYLGVDAKGKGRQSEGDNRDPSNLDGKIRWMRVNENKWTTEQAVEWLSENGWEEKNTLVEVVASSEYVQLRTSKTNSGCTDFYRVHLASASASTSTSQTYSPFQSNQSICPNFSRIKILV